jgi:nitric oxide reductase NorQ protein|tara:strand:- start:270 stop:1418 length:1149 start_codon:yes stop_codon:yes gene_type:complete
MSQNTIFVKVELVGSKMVATDQFGKEVSGILYGTRKSALSNGSALRNDEGNKWRRCPMSDYEYAVKEASAPEIPSEVPAEQAEIMNMIHTSYDLKPKTLMLSELKWKYLIRSAVRGKNIMMAGPAGCGKTMAAKALVNSLDRPEFYFNLGATQDPRATLIGNVTFDKEKGTAFSESLFVKAIQTENAIILMDELSRAHPDAWNILMTVLDQGQRYLRLDEAEDQATIKVADGVTFIATANIGNEYTATRVMDKALLDRFTIIEMDTLNAEQETDLLTMLFPLVDPTTSKSIGEIASLSRQEAQNETPRIDAGISTRTSVEVASLIFDGFSLAEAAEITIYPQYSNDGGVDSERTFMKQLVQKYCDDGQDEDLFNTEEVSENE